MFSFTITTAFTTALALTIPATLAQSSSSGSVPPCLTQCLAQTTQPCTGASLSNFISCINTQCSTSASNNTLDTDPSAASMSLTYTPKTQYSCQQSFTPGSSEDAPAMQLSGDGKCMTSPYDFQSLFVSVAADEGDGEGDEGGEGGMTIERMARQCSMLLYSDEGCDGEETKLDLSGVRGDKCVFKGGRSARLVCSVLRAPDTRVSSSQSSPVIDDTLTRALAASYADILGSLCSGNSTSGNSTGTSPNAGNSTSTSSPYGGSGSGAGSDGNTTSPTSPSSPSVSSQPLTGRASPDQVAKPSLIALVALFAVAVLLL